MALPKTNCQDQWYIGTMRDRTMVGNSEKKKRQNRASRKNGEKRCFEMESTLRNIIDKIGYTVSKTHLTSIGYPQGPNSNTNDTLTGMLSFDSPHIVVRPTINQQILDQLLLKRRSKLKKNFDIILFLIAGKNFPATCLSNGNGHNKLPYQYIIARYEPYDAMHIFPVHCDTRVQFQQPAQFRH